MSMAHMLGMLGGTLGAVGFAYYLCHLYDPRARPPVVSSCHIGL